MGVDSLIFFVLATESYFPSDRFFFFASELFARIIRKRSNICNCFTETYIYSSRELKNGCFLHWNIHCFLSETSFTFQFWKVNDFDRDIKKKSSYGKSHFLDFFLGIYILICNKYFHISSVYNQLYHDLFYLLYLAF